jgi:thiosulfate dehydrogenase
MVHPNPFVLLCFWTVRAVAAVVIGIAAAGAGRAQTVSPPVWTVPEVGALPDDDHGSLVRRGRDLITATYAHIGPEVPDSAKRFAGNNLACSNCHLEAGTKKFGLPIFGLVELFPQYSARLGAEITIEDRVNSCMSRSMNGRALPLDSLEMQAIVAYIRFLSSGFQPAKCCRDSELGRCLNSIGRPIPFVAKRYTRMLVWPVTIPTAPESAAACRPPISAIWCRRCGARTVSTMAPAWPG